MTEQANAKKILILLGSPRKKGNSATLAEQITKGAESAGAVVESVYLNRLDIRPCQACEGCRKDGAKGCVVDDDMQQLYPKISEADAIVYVSPVYWFTMSAQLKLVMDRCFAYGATGYKDLVGKKTAVAMSFGDADVFASGCVNALRTFQDAFKYIGMDLVGAVYGSADGAGEIAANTELMEKAEALGRILAD